MLPGVSIADVMINYFQDLRCKDTKSQEIWGLTLSFQFLLNSDSRLSSGDFCPISMSSSLINGRLAQLAFQTNLTDVHLSLKLDVTLLKAKIRGFWL